VPLAPIGPAPGAAAGAGSPTALGFEARLEAHLRGVPPVGAPAVQPLAEVVRGVEAAQARLDQVLAAARRGHAFTAGQLLALQADAYRLTQTLDLAGKLVETGVQGVKQAIATPV
jgi:hypothetical protein